MPPRQWSAREIRLLGTRPDAELARQFHCSLYSVARKRLSLKVPYLAPHYRRWTPAELKLLGTMPDT